MHSLFPDKANVESSTDCPDISLSNVIKVHYTLSFDYLALVIKKGNVPPAFHPDKSKPDHTGM